MMMKTKAKLKTPPEEVSLASFVLFIKFENHLTQLLFTENNCVALNPHNKLFLFMLLLGDKSIQVPTGKGHSSYNLPFS